MTQYKRKAVINLPVLNIKRLKPILEDNDMLDVSILIVNWNTKDLLKKCLYSLYKKNKKFTFEVIVVDNGSSDGSQEMVKREFTQVNLICVGENLGFAKANNIGIKTSHGRYVCLINSDVIVLDDTIQKLLEFMNRHPRIGISGPMILNPDLTFRASCMRFPTIPLTLAQTFYLDKIFTGLQLNMSYQENIVTRDVDVIAGCFWIVRKNALGEVGELDEDFFIYNEDIDWCRRFKMAGWRVVHYPDAKAIHLGNGSSSMAPIRFYLELQKSSFQYWGKYHSNLSMICYKVVKLIHEFLRLNIWMILYIIRPSKKKKAAFMIDRYKSSLMLLLFV